MKLRIGLILNFKKAEKKKDEMLNSNSRKRKWLSLATKIDCKKHTIKIGKKYFVPDDVALGCYIKSVYKNVIIDYITPGEISTRRLKKNHLNFVFIYDLLEAFHLSDKKKYSAYKNALKNSNNVYPPFKYQKFINNKCIYYKYLANKKIPVAPTHCVSREKWYIKDPNKYVDKIIGKVKANKWESIITKPVYGQESIDFAKFSSCPLKKSDLSCRKNQLMKYFKRNIPKYKSIVIQEYIPGFDKNNPEIRAFFINGKYMYSIITTDKRVGRPIEEGGKFKIKAFGYVKRLANRVMNSLPTFDLPKKYKNSILTRIDIGSGLEGVPHGYFVNEVEFVPSLYIEELDPDKFPVIEKIGNSLVDIAKIYSKRKRLTKTHF